MLGTFKKTVLPVRLRLIAVAVAILVLALIFVSIVIYSNLRSIALLSPEIVDHFPGPTLLTYPAMTATSAIQHK